MFTERRLQIFFFNRIATPSAPRMKRSCLAQSLQSHKWVLMDATRIIPESFAYLTWDLRAANTVPLAPWWALGRGMGRRELGINDNRPLFLDTAREEPIGSGLLHLRSLP